MARWFDARPAPIDRLRNRHGLRCRGAGWARTGMSLDGLRRRSASARINFADGGVSQFDSSR